LANINETNINLYNFC